MTNPVPTIPTAAEESQLIAMSPAQRRDYIDRMEHGIAKAAYEQKDAAFKAQIAAQTEAALAGNQHYQLMQRGQLAQRVTVQDGKTSIEQLNPSSNGSGHFAAPQALIDQLALDIGGINIGPRAAKEMLARGEITQAAYSAALNVKLSERGYSFR